MINKRIQRLRQESLEAVNRISPERAILLTEFYAKPDTNDLPIVIQRAASFRYLMQNKSIHIGNDELIVGERGPAPKATPTYPEISLHTLADLEMLDTRKKVSYKVDETTKEVYKQTIIPFWSGKTQRDRVFGNLSDTWKNAYAAGVFTEFQEQRAPGHTVAGKDVFSNGMLDLLEKIDKTKSTLSADEKSKMHQLQAMSITAQALIDFSKRHVEVLKTMLVEAQTDQRRNELIDMIRVCERVPSHAPETFHEALQHYWFIHVGVITELNPWDSFNPGRLDQHLYPFYKMGLEDGTLTRDKASELLQAFWIKFNNHPAPPKVGVTALESNTYTDFSLINLGGLTEIGEDAVNDLTFLILDIIQEMRLLQPSSMVQISKSNPDAFVRRALKIAGTGFGQPSFFNTDAIIQQLISQGKSLTDARNGGASGCVETGAFGTEAYTLSGYFNLNKVLELTLFNGYDSRTARQIGPKTGEVADFKSFEAFYKAFEQQLQHFVDIKIEGNNWIEECFAEHMPVPFMSLLISDCIDNAKDYNAGGARYNTSYVQGVGLGSITDNLASVKKWVFDEKELDFNALIRILELNFNDQLDWQQRFIFESPKWGNNDDTADHHAVRVFESFYKAVNGRPTFRGGVFRINLLPTTSHVYFGSVTGAMPDGRSAGKPLSEGISPVQGADTNGPVAVLQSAAKIDHLRTGGTLLNQKFTPDFFRSETALDNLTALIRTYFKMNGHHIQFNVVNADTLRKAQKHPEHYRDLIVRVAGYSDYFNDLGDDLQEEIINRTAHGLT
ncbi:MAG: formate C-acetyltransferase [Bacteroidetes bacterium]|nr:MAG: formate C-acetyltransferase [Bacteroidota bacterium]